MGTGDVRGATPLWVASFSANGGGLFGNDSEYRFESSPYEDNDLIGDLNGFSGGIGYSFGGSRLDLAFSRTEQDVNAFFFDSGINSAAMVNRINTNISLGYTFKF